MKYRYFVSFFDGSNFGNAVLTTNTRIEYLTDEGEAWNWINEVEKYAAQNAGVDHVVILSYQFINTIKEESEV